LFGTAHIYGPFTNEKLPNIGLACAHALPLLDILISQDLLDQNPFEMITRLCLLTGRQHAPCMIDLFMPVTSFMAGKPALP
jgi:hypothetical protein